MVAIQNNVVFWTRDYLEASSLVGRQHVVLWRGRTIAMPFPWAVGAARDGGHLKHIYLLQQLSQ